MSDLIILGPISNFSKIFKNVDEFNIYYMKNKDEMENMTTQKLNKLYSIDGYRITKKETRDKDGRLQKGIICLKKVAPKKKKEVETNECEMEMKNKIKELEIKVSFLTEQFNSLLETLNIGHP